MSVYNADQENVILQTIQVKSYSGKKKVDKLSN